MQFKHAGVLERLRLLDYWRRRKGQMIGGAGFMAPAEQP
jgi:hypothetical protein